MEDNKATDETEMGDNLASPPASPQKKIRRYTEEEMLAKLKEKGLDKPKMTTTMFVKGMKNLERIRRNLDIVVLLLHTLITLVCGGIVALGIYLDHKWLQAGGGASIGFMLLTLLINVIMPKGRLAEMINSPDFLEQIKRLSQHDLQKLIAKINETEHFDGFRGR